jgi:hypothetical protein
VYLQITAIKEVEAARDRIAAAFGTGAGWLRAGGHRC